MSMTEAAPRTGWVRRMVRWPFLALIRTYQLVISPWTGASCRFSPSCSTYAYQAIATHGVLRGSALAVRRLGRCHPWNPGGIDPVPPGHTAARGA
jgi:uncharacterized protein